ncbi:outer membrane protein assembly factor BamB family protein [Pseudoalteromonas luteoviolacea]|uniref:outer membrane protein assembly factor BamB family protein n=1 Tax=Pseudoalteromonas luteoviolacea TaxID=43657 RepID=UPI0009BCD6B1|nr:PQQ-binding-like beta-propeller repeat protein [Pseudoalteromonas luteoviolacea]
MQRQKSLYLLLMMAFLWGMSCQLYAKSGDYLYSFQTGSENWGSISLKGHLAYFGSDNGKLYSLDIDRAKLRWSFSSGDKVRSKPLIDQYRVYFTSDDGYLYALNRWTGKPIWQANLNDADYARVLPANHAPWEFDYTKSSPISDRTSVYVGSADGHFYAFVKRTGALRWKFKADGKIRSTASLYQGFVYVTTWGGTVYALDKLTGNVVWQYQTQGAVPSSQPWLVIF